MEFHLLDFFNWKSITHSYTPTIFILVLLMNTHSKLWLLFLGRLETEKGFDLIFDFINQYPGKELPFELYIFGSGSYEKWLLELSHHFKQIHFFGRKPLSEVERYLDNIDYCLMPSRFLETFWLSAINVLKRGNRKNNPKTYMKSQKNTLLINAKEAMT